MSSDFYFRKWKDTLERLERTVYFDLKYQTSKFHDKKRCQATQRLSSVLGQYMVIYNNIIECVNQNLQIQKTNYINDVLEAVTSRILELKSDIRKLDCSNYQFFGNGLVEHHVTTYDAEMLQLPTIAKRSVHIEAMIEKIFERAKEIREALVRKAKEKQQLKNITPEKVINWWDIEETSDSTTDTSEKQVEEQLSEENLKRRELIILIQAHERARQVRGWVRYHNYRRELWAKELSGGAPLPAPYKIREKAARLIQEIFRDYFKIKRKRVNSCKKDEMLGIRQCKEPNIKAQINAENIKVYRSNRLKVLEDEYVELYGTIKKQYLKRNGDNIKEDSRDFIRDWFYKWYKEIQWFHDIPTQNEGGLAIIVKEEMQSPYEWLEEYKRYMADKVANKNKTTMQIKYEKMETKRLEMMVKKEELMIKKREKMLLEEMMKNPNMHPAFNYPESKKTVPILKVIDSYKNEWKKFDCLETLDVKETFVKEKQHDNVCMEAKLKMLASVETDMRSELKILKTALKDDYLRNKEKMPEKIKPLKKRQKRKLKVMQTVSENIIDRMEDLLTHGIMKEYEKLKLEDFIGDPNFVGEDLRCSYKTAEPHNGDMRYIWWDSCREAAHDFHKRLLVGPKGSGKSRLVQILASVNDAILFELDPLHFESELISPVYLQQIVNSVASCAMALRPSVIHVKNVQKLYYSKIREEEINLNFDLIKRYIIKKLFNKVHKTDKITIIGSCENPWMTRSKQLLKQFPTVFLIPNANYSTVVELLKNWVLRNPVIPRDLDVNSLAYKLQGYSYGYLEDSLQKILSPERIIRIAAYGMSTDEFYDYLIGDEVEPKPEYEKYQKWYTENTTWGRNEKRHLLEQQDFQRALEKYAEKNKKKHPALPRSSSNSNSKTVD